MARAPILLLCFLVFLLAGVAPSHSTRFTVQPQFPPASTRQRAVLQEEELLGDLTLAPSDVDALRGIKAALADLPGSDFFSTWDFDSLAANTSPCTSFTGVTCSVAAGGGTLIRVTSLALGTGLADSPGLAGTLPRCLTNLTALTELIVFAGWVSGEIPADIGDSLPDLRFLSVTNNLVSGQIPASLGKVRDLHTLDLGHNRLSGQIPPPMLSLPSLKVLILASNGHLAGGIPAVNSPLLHLDLRGNSFSGELPSLPSTLRYFSASSNSLSGPLDAVAGLQNLTFLDLAMNALSGPIPASLFSPSVPLLLLQRNNLTGGLPPATSSGVAAEGGGGGGWTVDVSHNALTGEVTAVVAGAESLFLNNNQFVGAVPSEYARSVYAGTMKTFYAQHNFLTGFDFPLPPGSAPLPESVSVCLVYNCMAPPPVGPTVCPSSAGEAVSRPPSQCPVFSNGTGAATAGGGGR